MRRYTKIRIGRLISTVKISISPIYFPFFSIQELFLQNAVSIISTLRKGKESRRNRKECLPKKYIHADRQTDKNNALEKGKKGGGVLNNGSNVLSSHHLQIFYHELSRSMYYISTIQNSMHSGTLTNLAEEQQKSIIRQDIDLSHYKKEGEGCIYFRKSTEIGYGPEEKGLPKARHAFLSPAWPQGQPDLVNTPSLEKTSIVNSKIILKCY